MSELLIKKEDIGNCRRCEAKPEGVKFKGLLNIGHFTCSHFNSDDGWWLRIDHRRDSIWPDEEDKDFVGELLCPPCCKEHSENLKQILEL